MNLGCLSPCARKQVSYQQLLWPCQKASEINFNGVPIGLIWNNLGIKVKSHCDLLKHIKYIKVHEFIMR